MSYGRWTTYHERTLTDLLASERQMREQLQAEYRRALDLLERLARRFDGQRLEDHRRAHPQGTRGWTISDWERFFDGARLEGFKPSPGWRTRSGRNGNGHQKQEIENLRRELRELKNRLQAQVSPPPQADPPAEQAAKQQRTAAQAATPPRDDGDPRPLPSLDGYQAPLVPLRYAHLEKALGPLQWRRAAMILYLMATFGVNAHLEIDLHVAPREGLSPRSNSTRKPLKHLAEARLIVAQSLKIDRGEKGGFALKLLRLTDEGRALCRALGWTPVESDWERLIRLHQGKSLPEHTLAVLYFALMARARSWRVAVMPQQQAGNTPPDALVVKGDERHLVEVELSTRDVTAKWQNLQNAQGHVAICALDQAGRQRLVKDCQLAGIPGVATDLETLKQVRVYEIEKDDPLWLDRWDSSLVG